MTTVTVQFKVKDPDAWGEVVGRLKMKEALYAQYLEFREYGTIELTIDEDFGVVAARVVPR